MILDGFRFRCTLGEFTSTDFFRGTLIRTFLARDVVSQ